MGVRNDDDELDDELDDGGLLLARASASPHRRRRVPRSSDRSLARGNLSPFARARLDRRGSIRRRRGWMDATTTRVNDGNGGVRMFLTNRDDVRWVSDVAGMGTTRAIASGWWWCREKALKVC